MSQLTIALKRDAAEALTIGKTIEFTATAIVVGLESGLVWVGGNDALPGDTVKVTLEVTKTSIA